MIVATAVVLSLAGAASAFVGCKGDDSPAGFELRAAVPATSPGFELALFQTLGVSLTPGHEVKLASNGAIFDELETAIRGARSSVHVVMYIWEKGAASDRVLSALRERAKAGVACRIVIDDFGSPDFDEDVRPALAAAGCEVRTFRPILRGEDELARNHRKIVVVDGRIAFVGGFGVRDDWRGDGVMGDGWRDANVRFTGPSVAQAQQAIAENWLEAGGALFPADAFPSATASGPAAAAVVTSTAAPSGSRAERLTQLMIQAATRRLWIANAYFVPSRAIRAMLARKAEEGVDVRLLVPSHEKNDSKASAGIEPLQVGELIRRGVRVLAYQPSMMHAKTMVVDDELATVSSINLDPLSLGKLEEVALVVKDRAFADDLARTFEEDSVRSRPVEE